MRTEKFYKNRLNKYFMEHYPDYEETAEWYVDPAVNEWKFEIPGQGIILLTCHDDGKVTERKLGE